jgi:hypothetical protein
LAQLKSDSGAITLMLALAAMLSFASFRLDARTKPR